MYTADEIREITFTKTLGGYKTAEVDDFIDICAETVEELAKENAELTKKMEVLANKVVEYRNEEDSIRTALLSAQRMGDTVLREANHKAGLILEDAKIKAEKIEEVAQQQIQEQLDELERLKKLVSEFKHQVLGVYREHLSLIDVLPDYKPAAEDKEPEAAAEEETPAEMPVADDSFESPVEQAEAEEEPQIVPPVAPDADEEEEEPITLFGVDREEKPAEGGRFSDLKFGADYSIADDVEDDEEASEEGKKRSRRKLF